MNKLNKIKEAKYFYSQMVKTKEHSEEFKFNLSAFLSSSRSVLQYALREAEIKIDGKKWYDKQVTNDNVIKFLRDKRDINIHEEPLTTKRLVTIELSSTIHISDSVSISVKDKNGNIKSQSTSEFQPLKSAVENNLISIEYKFDDWEGDEDVLHICEEYLKKIEIIIEDGLNKGFFG
jgi:hypothetical protein